MFEVESSVHRKAKVPLINIKNPRLQEAGVRFIMALGGLLVEPSLVARAARKLP